jgi:hypothetical protein
MLRAVWSHGAVPCLIYLVSFTILTWPSMASFSTHFLCDAGDGFANVWNLWWVHETVTRAQSPWFTHYLFHPDGATLHGHTLNPFNGFLALPLWAFLPPWQVYNTVLVFAFVATGLTTFWLARHLRMGQVVSLFVGGSFTFTSYHFMRAYGHLDLLSLEWLPLFVLAWLALLDAPSHRRAVFAAGALFLVLLCNYYYTFYAVLLGVLLFVHRAWRHRRDPLLFLRREQLLPILSFTVSSALLAGSLLLPFWLQHRADPFIGAHDPARYGLDLLAPFVPGLSWRFSEWTEWFWLARDLVTGDFVVGGNPVDSCAFVRMSVLVPAAWAAWNFRRIRAGDCGAWILIAVVFFLLALGPRLRVFGATVPMPWMPYTALESLAPPLRMSGSPTRMVVVVMLGLSILAGYALPVLWRRAGPVARFLWIALFLFETWPYVLPRTQPPIPDWVLRLRELPPGAVAGLDGEPTDMRMQIVFDKPITTGYLARRPSSVTGHRREQRELMTAGRYRDVLDRFDARYLVVYKFDPMRARMSGLKPVFLGNEHDVFVRQEDELPRVDVPPRDCASGAEVATSVERDPASGEPAVLRLASPADAGRRFIVGFSHGVAPPIPIADGRQVPLASDAVFDLASQDPNPVFVGNHGRFDDAGAASVRLELRSEPSLRGRVLHYCVAVYDPDAPFELCRISGCGKIAVPD